MLFIYIIHVLSSSLILTRSFSLQIHHPLIHYAMSFLPIIAIIAPGAMGAAVAKRLTTAGLTVLTNLTNRSPATRKRAQDAGMQDASLVDIARRARWVLSILPPSEALGFAEKFREAYDGAEAKEERKIVFADCNAVNPETVKRIAALFAGSPIGFVDAGIIGGPPQEGYDPVFYASVDPQHDHLLNEFRALSEYGLKVSPLRGEGAGIGDASALKMSYAVRCSFLPQSRMRNNNIFVIGYHERHNWPFHNHDLRYIYPLAPFN